MVQSNRQHGFSQLDWTDEDDIAGFCQAAWDRRPSEQQRRERLTDLAKAYYTGDQDLAFVAAGEGVRLEQRPVDPDRVTVVFNRFRPLMEQWIARMVGGPLDYEATPTTAGSQTDLDAARVMNALVRYYADRLDFARLRENMVRRIGFGGLAFTKVAWDPQAGAELPFTAAELRRAAVPQDVLDRLFEQADSGGTLALGDAVFENVGLENLTWGPVGVPFEQAEWVVEARERSRAYVQARWNVKDDDLESAYKDVGRRWYNGTFGRHGSTVYEDQDPELVLTYELWVPRSALHPEGRFAVVIGGKVVNAKRNRKLRNPYRHGRVPYVPCRALESPDGVYGETVAWDAFGPQDQINRLSALMMEAAAQVCVRTIFVMEGSSPTPAELRRGLGDVLFFRGSMPQTLEAGELPATLNVMLQNWYRVMQDLFGVQDVSLGRGAPGVRSARQTVALQAADDTRSGPTVQALDRWAADVFRMLLCVLDQCVADERIIAVQGADKQWERFAFRGGQLARGADTSGPQAFNVRVRSSGRGRGPAAVMELVGWMLQSGLWQPNANPDDKRTIYNLLELGEASARVDPEQDDKDAMRRDIDRLLAGQTPHPQWFQNLTVRKGELLRFMNRDDFDAVAPVGSPLRARFGTYFREILAVQAVNQLEQGKIASDAQQAWLAEDAAKKQRAAPAAPGVPALRLGASPGGPVAPSMTAAA